MTILPRIDSSYTCRNAWGTVADRECRPKWDVTLAIRECVEGHDPLWAPSLGGVDSAGGVRHGRNAAEYVDGAPRLLGPRGLSR
jgi:hypothetical protein